MPVVPGTLNYHDPNDANLVKSHVIIAGRASVLGAGKEFYQEYRAQGRRVVQYIDFIDAWTPGPFDKMFLDPDTTTYAGGSAGTPTNWGGYQIIDIGDAAVRDRIVDGFRQAIEIDLFDDLMLDVFGTRLWTSTGWGRMSAAQQAGYAAGARDLANRFSAIRDARRPDMRMYANGTWNGEGHPGLCPAVENHDSELSLNPDNYWWRYINDLPWDRSGQGCAIVYTKSLTAAQKWAQVPGVGVVCIHPTDYLRPSGLALPYATLIPREGTAPAPPPPPPPPPPDLEVPTAPTGLVVGLGDVSGAIRVAWSPNPSVEAVKDYQVYLNGNRVVDVVDTSVVITGLNPQNVYMVRVSARNGDVLENGFGPWSPEIAVDLSEYVPPPPPPPPPPPDPDPDPDPTIEELQAEIANLRAVLGQTVSDLNAAREARDMALEQRDDAFTTVVALQTKIDGALEALRG